MITNSLRYTDRKMNMEIGLGVEDYSICSNEGLTIINVLYGEITVLIDMKTYVVNEHETAVINREDLQALEINAPNSIYLAFHINIYAYREWVEDLDILTIICRPSMYSQKQISLLPQINYYFGHILEAYINRENGYEERIIRNMISALTILSAHFNLSGKNPTVYRSNEQIQRIWKVMQYIETNANRKLTLTEVAEHVHVSAVYLSRIIKEISGLNFEGWVGYIRASLALEHVLKNKLSFTQISYDCGFSDPRYFKKAFQKTYGYTPKELRDKYSDAIEKPFWDRRNRYEHHKQDQQLMERISQKAHIYMKLKGYSLQRNTDATVETDIKLDFTKEGGATFSKHFIEIVLNNKKVLLDDFHYNSLRKTCHDLKVASLKSTHMEWNSKEKQLAQLRLNMVKDEFQLELHQFFEASNKIFNVENEQKFNEELFDSYMKLDGCSEVSFFVNNVMKAEMEYSGLFDLLGFRTPVYFGLEFLQNMKGNIVSQNNYYIATKTENEMRIFLYPYEDIFAHENRVMLPMSTELLDEVKKTIITITIAGLKEKTYLLQSLKYDLKTSNYMERVANNKAFMYLSQQKKEHLIRQCEPQIYIDYVEHENEIRIEAQADIMQLLVLKEIP